MKNENILDDPHVAADPTVDGPTNHDLETDRAVSVPNSPKLRNKTLALPGSDEVNSVAATQRENEIARRKRSGETRQLDTRYTLLRMLGHGGLGDVWLARDEYLNRNVAIKEMNRSALKSEKAWLRFHREAEITGHLEHPNVVPLYQAGTHPETNEPFYAMRFVGKRTLEDAIGEYHERCQLGKCDPLLLHRLLTAFLDVCQAIAYSHSRGVIHRDLKPSNVALDNFGQVIVLDWGLAKVADDGELGSQLSGDQDISDSVLAKTMAGEAIGTPLYMAPEQASGDLEAIDHKTDIYGLGAILFAILTGRAPHEDLGENGQAIDSVEDMLKQIAARDAPSPRDFSKSIPVELEAICQKAMARKKYIRHDTASDLATEVERWMVDQGRRQAEYENMRMEGRELRANLQSEIRDLEANARFMSSLPPVQELIHGEPDRIQDWRDRLIKIYSGLLRAKPNFRSLVYCRVDDDQFEEIVRVERNSTEHANVRSIPRSRLRKEALSQYIKDVMNQNPEEVHTSLVCNPMCDSCLVEGDDLRLAAGVPVFDHATEELFGVVLIECDLDRVIKQQMDRRMTAADVVVACDTFHVMMHNHTTKGWIDASVGKPVESILPKFNQAVDALRFSTEYIDENDRRIYGARLWLVPRKHGLMFLLSQQ